MLDCLLEYPNTPLRVPEAVELYTGNVALRTLKILPSGESWVLDRQSRHYIDEYVGTTLWYLQDSGDDEEYGSIHYLREEDSDRNPLLFLRYVYSTGSDE